MMIYNIYDILLIRNNYVIIYSKTVKHTILIQIQLMMIIDNLYITILYFHIFAVV